ncbi:hypothetical protein [Nonomuraea candida]|uniref:hypothetical protein n=1 Tax=Nonomuraea candida TaxID=359159 RepID=UPI0005BA8174|nr:hypothetical protein [Nonomuraea candida]
MTRIRRSIQWQDDERSARRRQEAIQRIVGEAPPPRRAPDTITVTVTDTDAGEPEEDGPHPAEPTATLPDPRPRP